MRAGLDCDTPRGPRMNATAVCCGLAAVAAVTLLHEALVVHRRAAVAQHRRMPGAQSATARARVIGMQALSVERRVALALPAVLVVGVVAGVLPGALVGAGVIGLPSVSQRVGRWRRDQSVEAALPQLLDEMARGMRAGLSPSIAFVEAIRVAPAPVVMAASDVVDRLRSGDDLVRASAAWATERASPGTELLATAVAVGSVVGGVHARTIDAVAATLRERQAMDAELATQALQARLSALVMTIAPIVFCGFLVLSDPRASHFLLRTPMGIVCAMVGIALDTVAALWMARIAQGARR